jgi:putative endonuclease
LKYWVYILKSEVTGKYYIGSTGDINDRLRRHNSGRSKYTKSGIPWKLVYTEAFNEQRAAVARERQLKSWKSRIRIEELIKKNLAQ